MDLDCRAVEGAPMASAIEWHVDGKRLSENHWISGNARISDTRFLVTPFLNGMEVECSALNAAGEVIQTESIILAYAGAGENEHTPGTL